MVKEFGIWVHTGSLPAGSEMPDLAEKIREARLNELIKFAMKSKQTKSQKQGVPIQ